MVNRSAEKLKRCGSLSEMFCALMAALFKITRRSLWGDYGDVLLQGEYYRKHRNYRGFAPVSSIVYPRSDLIVDERAMETLANACPNCLFRQCNDVTLYKFDWRAHTHGKQPPYYPPGGEPKNYFQSGLDFADPIPMWQMIVKDVIQLERPSFDYVLQSIRESCTVPEPEIPAGVSLPDAPIFAARYAPDGPNVAYYLRSDMQAALGDLLADAVILLDL